jgi:regulator of sigma D
MICRTFVDEESREVIDFTLQRLGQFLDFFDDQFSCAHIVIYRRIIFECKSLGYKETRLLNTIQESQRSRTRRRERFSNQPQATYPTASHRPIENQP